MESIGLIIDDDHGVNNQSWTDIYDSISTHPSIAKLDFCVDYNRDEESKYC